MYMAHANLPLRSYHGTHSGRSRYARRGFFWHTGSQGASSGVRVGAVGARAARDMLYCGLRESLESALHAQLALGLADLCESRAFTGMDNV